MFDDAIKKNNYFLNKKEELLNIVFVSKKYVTICNK